MKKYIYRDLSPNNLIIDPNNNLYLIDFNKMININDEGEITQNTSMDFSHFFVCPEINNGTIKEYIFKEDIYSIGFLIYFILIEEYPLLCYGNGLDEINYSFVKLNRKYPILKKISENCTKIDYIQEIIRQ